MLVKYIDIDRQKDRYITADLIACKRYCYTFLDFELGDILMEFMEVAINLILYTRNIYPDGIFKKCQKYGVSVMVKLIIMKNLIL